MKNIILCAFMLSAIQLHAQRHVTLKIYQNTDIYSVTTRSWSQDTRLFTDYSSKYVIRATRPSFGVMWDLKNNKYNNEIELSFANTPAGSHIYNNKYDYPIKLQCYYISLGYGINKLLYDNNQSLKFYFGSYLDTYIYETVSEENSYTYQTIEDYTGVRMSVVPRLCVKLTPRIQLDLSSKLSVAQLNKYRLRIEDLQVRPEDRTIEEKVEPKLLPSLFNFRLGLSFALYK